MCEKARYVAGFVLVRTLAAKKRWHLDHLPTVRKEEDIEREDDEDGKVEDKEDDSDHLG